jgi:hypothetical protein
MKRLLSLFLGMLIPLFALADVAPVDSDALLAGGLTIGIIALIIVGIIIHIAICLVPFFMARKRGRSGLLWMLVSFFIGWWWTIIILLIIGDSTEKKLKDMGMYQQS